MRTYSREDVLLAARNVFSADNLNFVIEILDKYEDVSTEQGRARVQLAILKLSEGDISKLQTYIEKAGQDFRDVIYWAEYTREDERIENPYGILLAPPRI